MTAVVSEAELAWEEPPTLLPPTLAPPVLPTPDLNAAVLPLRNSNGQASAHMET